MKDLDATIASNISANGLPVACSNCCMSTGYRWLDSDAADEDFDIAICIECGADSPGKETMQTL